MSAERPVYFADDPMARLERALIAEFLERRGYNPDSLHDLPIHEAQAIMKEASLYASGRLTEVESRAHFIDDMHHAPQPATRRR